MKIYCIAIFAAVIAGCTGGKAEKTLTQDSVEHTLQSESTTIDVPAFNADSAYAYVERQVAMGTRVPGTATHARCAGFIADELVRHGADSVWFQTGTVKAHTGEKLPVKNIMARFNGNASRRVLIAAHYDTRPWADEERNPSAQKTPIAGANDGASGVGVILELARLIGAQSPNIGVDFLLTDVEDYGAHDDENSSESSWCLGSQYWAANNPYSNHKLPAYGILLDMVGGKGAQFYREYFSDQVAPVINNKVWGMAEKLGIGRFVNEMRGAVTDDHIFITSVGIPCIDIIECANPRTGTFPSYWHTLEDDMRNIDPVTLGEVGCVVTHVIYNEKVQ